MSRSAALCFDDTLASTRELRFASTEDVSALRTHLCCLSARLLFLLAHGLLVVSIAASLETIEAGQANWWLIFLPAWIGNACCLLLLTFSWCASCPYIKRCLAERTPRLHNHPSILTEILPEIVLTIPGLTFVVLAICAEHSFCAYLMSVQQGQPQSTTGCAVLFSMLALLAVCQGALFRDNSVLWLSLGTGLLVSTIAFAVCEGDCSAPGKAVVVMPFWLSVLCLFLASVWRMRSYAHVLQQDELILLRIEAVLLALLALCLLSVLAKAWQAKLGQAEVDGCFTGAILCMLAFPKGTALRLGGKARPVGGQDILATGRHTTLGFFGGVGSDSTGEHREVAVSYAAVNLLPCVFGPQTGKAILPLHVSLVEARPSVQQAEEIYFYDGTYSTECRC